MEILDENMMRNLSFPDFEVEAMELFPQEKVLKIFLEGTWLDVDDGIKLGKGFLFFHDWEVLKITRFNSSTEKWAEVDEFPIEPLRDLCEVKILDSSVFLSGFGRLFGQWMEWKIVNAKMCAEFES